MKKFYTFFGAAIFWVLVPAVGLFVAYAFGMDRGWDSGRQAGISFINNTEISKRIEQEKRKELEDLMSLKHSAVQVDFLERVSDMDAQTYLTTEYRISGLEIESLYYYRRINALRKEMGLPVLKASQLNQHN